MRKIINSLRIISSINGDTSLSSPRDIPSSALGYKYMFYFVSTSAAVLSTAAVAFLSSSSSSPPPPTEPWHDECQSPPPSTPPPPPPLPSPHSLPSPFYPAMDHATVALFLAFSCAACSAATFVTGVLPPPFGYPDDDHVIITQYGPMRYRPATEADMTRPYGDSGTRVPSSHRRGYYKAEVIPLDMKTWKPLEPGGGGTGSRFDAIDVPLRVGYSVRPAVRRRRHDYFLSAGRPRPPQSPVAAGLFRTF